MGRGFQPSSSRLQSRFAAALRQAASPAPAGPLASLGRALSATAAEGAADKGAAAQAVEAPVGGGRVTLILHGKRADEADVRAAVQTQRLGRHAL